MLILKCIISHLHLSVHTHTHAHAHTHTQTDMTKWVINGKEWFTGIHGYEELLHY